jgi:hypothetical protein
MATAIFDSMVDHSPLDGTNDAINGAEVDANPNTVAKILDGTTTTDLATDAAVDFRYTQSRVGLRAICTDNAAGSLGAGLTIEWDPGDGGNMTNNASGVSMDFKMPDDGDTQQVFGQLAVMCVDDDASNAEEGEFSFRLAKPGDSTDTPAEIMTLAPTTGLTVGVDDTGYDVKFFGASAGAYMEWDESADQLRIMGASADATTSTGKLLLATSLTDINANDVLGKIDFQAPHEAGGTDAITVAASIQAIAQGTFSASVNATDLIFYTGHSEAATEKLRITSQGEIGIGGANYGSDGQVLTSGGAGAAPAWESPTTGDITGVTAGVGLSGGGSSGGVTLTLDLSELSAVTPASGDWFATLDSDGANEQLTTTDALATLFAGTGLTASSAVIGVDAAQSGITSLGTLTALTVDDVAINGKVITMTGSSSDTVVFTAGTNGTLEIVTTDAAAAAANIQITADGTVDIDSAGVLTLDSGAAINIEPATGSAILLDGTISIDAGVITGATAITLSGELDAGSLDVSGDANIAGEVQTAGIGFTDGDNAITIADGGLCTLTAGAAVGIARTDGTLHVHSASADSGGDTIAADGNFNDLVVENNGNAGISILTTDGGQAAIAFGSPTGTSGMGRITTRYNGGSDYMDFQVNNQEHFRISGAGLVTVGEAITNANMTVGLTIDQKTNDDEAFALKSSTDIAHGITGYTETNTYFYAKKYHATSGAAQLTGLSEDHAIGLELAGIAGTPSTADAQSGTLGVVNIDGRKKDGTSTAACAATENVFVVANSGGAEFVIKGNGDIHATDTTMAGLDVDVETGHRHDDVGMIRAYQRTTHSDIGIAISKWDESIRANREDLRRVGVIRGDFVCLQRMNALLGGGIWQNYERIMDTREQLQSAMDERDNKIALLEQRLNQLEN